MVNKITKESECAAFISYRHVAQDRQWAEWLIQALETYRIPKHLQDLGYPQRIGKVFRDEDELPLSSDLTDQIKQALAVSRNLIVICSPDTPQSKWIAREIEMFKELGKANRIHAFLIEGEPQNAFPEELRLQRKTITAADGTVSTVIEEHEPLAANVTPLAGVSKKQRDKAALLKLVAAIIGCSYDDLVQRDKAREKKKQNILRSMMASILLLVSLGGFYWWDFNRLKVTYYENMVTRWAVPQGLFPVSEQQARKRNKTFRFESRRNRVERVVMQNGLGFPTKGEFMTYESSDGAQWHYSYDESGKIRQVDVFDQTTKVLWQEVYSQDLKSISFKKDNRDLALSSLNGFFDEDINRSRSEITRHEVEYLDGYIIRRRFTNSYGSPKGTVDNTYGIAYERDKNGLISSMIRLDQTNMQKPNPIKYEIDSESGRVQAVSFFFWRGYVRWFFIYDQNGNIIKQGGSDENSATAYFYDKNGNITEEVSGNSKKTFLYDERGNITEEAYSKIDGEPMLGKVGYARMTSTHDWNGNKIEEAYYGVDGKLLLNWKGYARVTSVFDKRGNNIEEAFFGVDGNPTLIKYGYAKLAQKYDERGNEIEEAYFGIDGKLVLNEHDYAKVTRIFDERGNKIEEVFLGVDGNPTLNKNGYTKLTQEYDERGNEIEEAYFGVNGSLALIKDGYARITQKYNERKNVIERAYFGIDGKFVLNKYGYAKETWVHDEKGNVIEDAQYNKDGKLILNSFGCAKETAVYDNHGKSERVCLGVDGKPVMNKYGYAKENWVHDEKGNVIEHAQYNKDGKLILNSSGCAKETAVYDNHGRSERVCLGVDGKPVMNKDGYAKSIFVNYGSGEYEVTHFDVNGKPVLIKDGYAKMTKH